MKKDCRDLQDQEASVESQARLVQWVLRVREEVKALTDTPAARGPKESQETTVWTESKDNRESRDPLDHLYQHRQRKVRRVHPDLGVCRGSEVKMGTWVSLDGPVRREFPEIPESAVWPDHPAWSWTEREESPACLEGLDFQESREEEDFKELKAKTGEMGNPAWDCRAWKACQAFQADPEDLDQLEILAIQVLRVSPAMVLPLRADEAGQGQRVLGARPECRVYPVFPAPRASKVQKDKIAASVHRRQTGRKETTETRVFPEFREFLGLRDSWVRTGPKASWENLALRDSPVVKEVQAAMVSMVSLV